MTLLCAPLKELISTEEVDLLEIDHGEYKILYEQGSSKFIDIDWTKNNTSSLPTIISYHNFEETPDLEEIYSMLKSKHPHATFYKIATFARSTLDSLRMLNFLKNHTDVIGLCMGELGQITRICAPIFSVPISYAPLNEHSKNAPGQLTVSELCEIYHFRNLNHSTEIFGLIGSPINHSPGHYFHNHYFRAQNRNAVYVKMPLQPEELSSFFHLIKDLPFKGLSVTAPLKEKIIPSKPINTLVFFQNKMEGFNTDGAAAIEVLGDVIGKTIVILGAGGSAKAIASSALKNEAYVTLVNRTTHKAQKLADELGCAWSEKVPPYDILINATSGSPNIDLLSGKTVMDINHFETEFFRKAKEKGCCCIDGKPLYERQALLQQKLWN